MGGRGWGQFCHARCYCFDFQQDNSLKNLATFGKRMVVTESKLEATKVVSFFKK